MMFLSNRKCILAYSFQPHNQNKRRFFVFDCSLGNVFQIKEDQGQNQLKRQTSFTLVLSGSSQAKCHARDETCQSISMQFMIDRPVCFIPPVFSSREVENPL